MAAVLKFAFGVVTVYEHTHKTIVLKTKSMINSTIDVRVSITIRQTFSVDQAGHFFEIYCGGNVLLKPGHWFYWCMDDACRKRCSWIKSCFHDSTPEWRSAKTKDWIGVRVTKKGVSAINGKSMKETSNLAIKITMNSHKTDRNDISYSRIISQNARKMATSIPKEPTTSP